MVYFIMTQNFNKLQLLKTLRCNSYGKTLKVWTLTMSIVFKAVSFVQLNFDLHK